MLTSYCHYLFTKVKINCFSAKSSQLEPREHLEKGRDGHQHGRKWRRCRKLDGRSHIEAGHWRSVGEGHSVCGAGCSN